jgi:nucleolar GTP-binding protein
MLVINKVDVMRLDDVHADSRALVQEIIEQEGVQCVQVSCHSEEGVMDLKNKACDALLAHRVENKMRGTKVNSIINRIHVAQPKPRDDVARPAFIPDAVKQKQKYEKDDPVRRKLLKDRELEEGGAGVFNINLRGALVFFINAICKLIPLFPENYLLSNPEWKLDIIPEIMDGKNIADFIDPDIAEKLEALEREEERLAAEGFYDSDSDIVRSLSPRKTAKFRFNHSLRTQFDSDDEREAKEAKVALRHKIKSQSIKKSKKNQSRLPRTAGLRTLSELTTELTNAGFDTTKIQQRAEMIAKIQGAKRKRDDRDAEGEGEDEDVDMDHTDQEGNDGDDGPEAWMDVDEDERSPHKKLKTNSGGVINKREPKSNRQVAGLRDEGVSSSPFEISFRKKTLNPILFVIAIQESHPTAKSRSTA